MGRRTLAARHECIGSLETMTDERAPASPTPQLPTHDFQALAFVQDRQTKRRVQQ